MKYFRHKITGLVGLYPAHFADFDYMIEVTSNDVPCCGGGLDDDDEPIASENDEKEDDE